LTVGGNGGDERSGGERNANHGHDPAGSAGQCSYSDESGRTEREPSQRVYLHGIGDSERAYQSDGCRRRPPGPTYVSGQGYYNSTSLTTHTTASFNSTGGDLILLFASSHAGVTFTPSDSLGKHLDLDNWADQHGIGFRFTFAGVVCAPHPTVGAAQTVT